MLAEIRSTGGQSLYPPSRHPNGEVLAWEEDGEPATVAAADLRRAVARVAAGSLLARGWPAEGSRHDAARALAGMLCRADWAEDEVAKYIEAVARAAGDEEAAERGRNAKTTARRLAGDGKATGGPTLEKLVGAAVVAKVREWLELAPGDEAPAGWDAPVPFAAVEVPPFPVPVLPAWLGEWVQAEALATQTAPDLAALLGLAVCSAAVAKKFEVEVKPGWKEPLNIFVTCALAPGERKSAVFRDATRPLLEYERDLAREAAPQIAKTASRRRVAERVLQRAETKAAKEGATECDAEEAARLAAQLAKERIPVAPRLVAGDVTSEKLAMLLREHGGRMALLSAEGGIFETMAGRYSEAGAVNIDVYLQAHAGDPLIVDRVRRGGEYVRAPALTIGLAVQPEVLRGLASKPSFRGRGLLARFAYSLPRSRVGHRDVDPPAVPAAVSEAYRRNVLELARLPEGREADGEIIPATIAISGEARAALLAFSAELEPKLGPGGAVGFIADWGAKLVGAVARISGVIHLADPGAEGATGPVGAVSVERAIEIGRYLLEHAQAAFKAMGADPATEGARAVLAWLARRGMTESRRFVTEFKKRDVFRAFQGRFATVEDLDPALQALELRAYIRERPAPDRPGRKGRKPSAVYDVNPAVGVDSVNLSEFDGGGGADRKAASQAGSEGFVNTSNLSTREEGKEDRGRDKRKEKEKRKPSSSDNFDELTELADEGEL